MEVGIVGGGVTGLALAHHLSLRDISCTVFEEKPRPGGVIRSERVDGHLVEYGPQRIRKTPPVSEVIDQTGIEDEVVVADDSLPTYVYADGELNVAPLTFREFLTTDLLSNRAKCRVLKEPFTESASPDETVAEVFRRKFGGEVYRNLLDPLFGGIYASDPDEMYVRHGLTGLVRLEEKWEDFLSVALMRKLRGESSPPISFEGGIQRLADALYEENAERVRLDSAVLEVSESDAGYRVTTQKDEHVFDEVVVTVPAPAAAEVLADTDPESAAALGELNYNPIAVVHLHAECSREAFGYQIRRDEPLETRGVTWNDSLFDRDGVYTAFIGGMENREVLNLDDCVLAATAEREFEHVTGCEAETINVGRVQGYPAYDRSWEALDRVDLPKGIHLTTNYTGRIGVPSRVRIAKQLAEGFAERSTG